MHTHPHTKTFTDHIWTLIGYSLTDPHINGPMAKVHIKTDTHINPYPNPKCGSTDALPEPTATLGCSQPSPRTTS